MVRVFLNLDEAKPLPGCLSSQCLFPHKCTLTPGASHSVRVDWICPILYCVHHTHTQYLALRWRSVHIQLHNDHKIFYAAILNAGYTQTSWELVKMGTIHCWVKKAGNKFYNYDWVSVKKKDMYLKQELEYTKILSLNPLSIVTRMIPLLYFPNVL